MAVPGVGAEEDYAGIDVTGKAALILRGEISFGAIARTVRYALDHVDPGSDAYTLPEILAADQAARACARQYISTKE